jgi:hypothetical protein
VWQWLGGCESFIVGCGASLRSFWYQDGGISSFLIFFDYGKWPFVGFFTGYWFVFDGIIW